MKLLKEDPLVAMIDSLINDREMQLRELEVNKAILDDEIDKLNLLYDSEDESSMPDETYLVRGEEILSIPNILREQRIKVETFLRDATERVDKLLAIQEEEIKEAEAKEEKEKQAQTEQTNQEASSVEEEETQEEKISKDEVENLVKQYLDLDDHPNIHVEYDHDNENGDYVVQVFEVVINDPVTKKGHRATWGWYGVDPVNGCVYDAFNY